LDHLHINLAQMGKVIDILPGIKGLLPVWLPKWHYIY